MDSWFNTAEKENREKMLRELHIQYKVKGIPLLLILDSVTGEVVCKNAGNELKTDPEGKKFPWKLRPLSDILAGNVIDNEMKTLSLDSLKGKVLGIYFSAHWCPPCKTFTPVLKGTYEKIKETGQPFEIIFATKDHNVQLRNGDFDYGTSGINSYLYIFCGDVGSLDLTDCVISPLISPTYCSAAGVDCGYGSSTTTITPTDSIGIYNIRLVDGPSSNEGRIEIWYNGRWNTICGDTWTQNSAEVVCRQLGYDTEDVEISTGSYGQGSGPIQQAQCFGWEYTLDDCILSSGIYLCNHYNDAGVRCGYTSSGTTSRRLIGTMAFVGVALFLITIAAIVAVVFVCSQQKTPAGATAGMQQFTTLTTTPGPTQASATPMPAPVPVDVPV
nr:uncharacterized protein LOC129284187 [Lytechinus pictus]